MRFSAVAIGASLSLAACGALVGSSGGESKPDEATQLDGAAPPDGSTTRPGDGGAIERDASGDASNDGGGCPTGTSPGAIDGECAVLDSTSCAGAVELTQGVVLTGNVCAGAGSIAVCPSDGLTAAVVFHTTTDVSAKLTVPEGVALKTNDVTTPACGATGGNGCNNYGASAGAPNVLTLTIAAGYYAIATPTTGCHPFQLELTQ